MEAEGKGIREKKRELEVDYGRGNKMSLKKLEEAVRRGRREEEGVMQRGKEAKGGRTKNGKVET